jgi:hypothetical protein
MSFFTLVSKKKWPSYVQETEIISEVTVFKNQYFSDKKYRPLAVLRKEASNSLLQACQI